VDNSADRSHRPDEPAARRGAAGARLLDQVGLAEVLQVFGAVAGAAVLVYVVGATLMWLRFQTTGFPADLALAAVPRERLVTLGLRSIGAWLVVVAIVLGGVHVVHRLFRRNNGDGGGRTDRLADRRATRLMGWVLAIAAIVASAFLTWSALTVVLAVIAGVVFARWYRRRVERSRWLVAAFVAILTAFVSIGWQLQINLRYDHAQFRLKGEPASGTRDAIYFGDEGGAVYLAPREPEPSKAFIRGIAIVPREDIANLRLLPGYQTLCTKVAPPATAAWRAVETLGDLVEQHLRKTGQPDPTEPEPQPDEPLAPGECPPQ
jgi:hypothetical protein